MSVYCRFVLTIRIKASINLGVWFKTYYIYIYKSKLTLRSAQISNVYNLI